ncbi:MAG: integration host factor subunit beta [Proteobacteria bacterium]|nr:integration host factor subunit beta [Pseudomonadota bacterium]
MTRSDLIDALAARFTALTRADADAAVKLILETLNTTLAAGNRVEIRGFGSFGLNLRKPRIGRNPKSGEKVEVPAKFVPHFKSGKELQERVDYPKAVARKVA